MDSKDAVEGMPPKYKWAVAFVRVDALGVAIRDSLWTWTGEEYSAGNAVETAINAMCDAADDPGRRRILRVTNVTLANQLGERS